MAKYVGGPCDGLGIGAQTGPALVCAGVTYLKGADGDYHVEAGGSGPVGVEALGTHAPRGWADLRQAVNVALPTGLARAHRLNRAARQKLVQRRKMR